MIISPWVEQKGGRADFDSSGTRATTTLVTLARSAKLSRLIISATRLQPIATHDQRSGYGGGITACTGEVCALSSLLEFTAVVS